MNVIRVVNRTRGTLLGNRIMLVDSWPGRLRGYLGRPAPEPGEGMLLVQCNAVHMYGLAFPLDLVFMSHGGDVVKTIEALQPWKRSPRVGDAHFALELPAGAIAASYTHVGDRLVWTAPQPSFSPPPRLDDTWSAETGPWYNHSERHTDS